MKDRAQAKKVVRIRGRKNVRDEAELIRLLRAPLDRGVKPKSLLLENGHDAAVLTAFTKSSLALTVDRIVEDVHFRSLWSDERSIAAKVFASNVSDLLAVGAMPEFGLLSLTFSRAPVASVFVRALGAAFAAEARRYRMRVVGGNVTRAAGPFTADLTALGSLTGRPFRRDALRSGMSILAVGRHGEAGAGLALLEHFALVSRVPAAFRPLVRAQLYPRVRPEVVAALRVARGPVAAMDTSDGLAFTVATLASESSCAVDVLAESVAGSAALRHAAGAIRCSAAQWIATGGEDYGLVVGVAAADEAAVIRALTTRRIAVALLGHARRGRGVRGWLAAEAATAWDPFR